jgi:pantothenate kinase
VSLIAKSNGRPKVIAIAGVPAERLATRLNDGAKGCAAILLVDGCHYDRCALFERVFHARKGAPEAFHVLGLLHMLDRLRRNLRMRSPSRS